MYRGKRAQRQVGDGQRGENGDVYNTIKLYLC